MNPTKQQMLELWQIYNRFYLTLCKWGMNDRIPGLENISEAMKQLMFYHGEITWKELIEAVDNQEPDTQDCIE